jgi:predicted short-subunit dehydrogenase-like oxidoreductase (DUF2520 family)
MIVTIIGTGNVATVLSKLILSKGHNILQIYGRTNESAKTLADHVHAEAIIDVEKLNLNADIYIVCVADKAIEIITKKLHVNNKLLLHTAGSVKKEILQNSSSNFGVLYPIQSIRKDMNLEIKIPFLIDANNVESLNQLEKFAKSISNDVTSGNDVQRLNLHIAAVFANNFVNYMYVQSAIICEENNLEFTLLQPLIEETALRLKTNHPKDVFTGPAIRKDTTTIQKHQQALAQQPKLLELYNSITKMIMEH